MKKSGIAFLACALASGCTFTANTEVDGDIVLNLGQLGSTCSGEGSQTTDAGQTDWRKSSDGTTCRVSADWSGNLVDMPMVRAKVEEQLKKNNSSLDKADVSFDHITLTFSNARLDPSLPVGDITLTLDLGAERLLDQSASSLSGVNGTVMMSQASIDSALAAFRDNRPLQATGKASFTVPQRSLGDVARDTKLTVGVSTAVGAKLTIKQL
jgi:hypothetical protein